MTLPEPSHAGHSFPSTLPVPPHSGHFSLSDWVGGSDGASLPGMPPTYPRTREREHRP
jgi:hypothetical protein